MASRCKRKVAVFGPDAVGSTFSYTLAKSGQTDEIVLIDKNEPTQVYILRPPSCGDPVKP